MTQYVRSRTYSNKKKSKQSNLKGNKNITTKILKNQAINSRKCVGTFALNLLILILGIKVS